MEISICTFVSLMEPTTVDGIQRKGSSCSHIGQDSIIGRRRMASAVDSAATRHCHQHKFQNTNPFGCGLARNTTSNQRVKLPFQRRQRQASKKSDRPTHQRAKRISLLRGYTLPLPTKSTPEGNDHHTQVSCDDSTAATRPDSWTRSRRLITA